MEPANLQWIQYYLSFTDFRNKYLDISEQKDSI